MESCIQRRPGKRAGRLAKPDKGHQMTKTIQTVLHTYRFNIEEPQDAASYEALKPALESVGFPVWTESVYKYSAADAAARAHEAFQKRIRALDGKPVTLELTHL